jgi:microsomal dipeptidase-like Zn-dependent dipeptidase
MSTRPPSLDLVRSFVGDHVEDLARHLEHGLKLGLEAGLVLGTDFFWEGDMPSAQTSSDPNRFFFPRYDDASCHPTLQRMLREVLGLDASALDALCNENARRFLESRLGR